MFLILSAELPITALFNKLDRMLGGPVEALLNALGLHPHHGQPFTNWVAIQIFTVLALIVVFAIVRSRLSVDNPGTLQHIAEGFYNFIENQSRELIGHHYHSFTPFLLSLGLFILSMNLIGLIPGFESPTANPSVPLGCAIASFVYYNFHGLRAHGPAYVKQFIGPVWWLGPLVLVIEIISHLARMLSLTVRLFANIFAGDMLTLAFFSLVPLGVPIIFLGLHLGVSLIQTYIFVLLSTVYLAGAVSEEH
jgi:F-type H+-transporting ATPase subunit a